MTAAAPSSAFLIGNLHCETCVSTIKGVLQDVEQVRWVSPDVIRSLVTVGHDTGASLRHMKEALEEAGFEVRGVASSGDEANTEDGRLIDNERAVARDMILRRDHREAADEIAGLADSLARWISPSKLGSTSSYLARLGREQSHLRNCKQCRRQAHGRGGQGGRLQTCSRTPLLADSASARRYESMAPSDTTRGSLALDSSSQPASPVSTFRATIAVGGMTCASCVSTLVQEVDRLGDWVKKATVSLVSNSAMVEFEGQGNEQKLVEAIESIGYEASLDTVTELGQEQEQKEGMAGHTCNLWRATLTVGGMTCASCAHSITTELLKRDWIRDATVNLVSNSAAIEFEGKGNETRLVEAIQNLGYEAAINDVVGLSREKQGGLVRTVEMLVDGVYCEHCPPRITKSLEQLAPSLRVLRRPTLQEPIVKVAYVPDAPRFTVRHIMAAIEASDSALKASIYHAPTLEERSKHMIRQHQRQLLRRAILTGIVCVPTFILGIVFMSLVPEHNPTRNYLMASWVSGISRAQFLMLVLATPVYFFAADLFHVRAVKEMRNLWRRGSRVPVLKRFYRFGSMNTLLSLGTSIAYLSSVAQMTAAGARHSHLHVDDSNFYFDSVVFLTFFLLVGKLIESYSKTRMGDAVETLGRLRPATAVLVDGFATGKPVDRVVQADELEFGDVVRVPHGQSPPADGMVVSVQSAGGGLFDESSLTGESRPVPKKDGDLVYAGTVNKGAVVLVRITGAAGHSMLDQIVAAVRQGQTKRAPVEEIADKLTTYFVPLITLMAVLTWLLWMALGYGGVVPPDYLDGVAGGWMAFSLQFAIAVFVVACPCGLGMAAPTAIFVGGGIAAKHGILVKGGGEAFEKASRVDCVVFDKTGTLTEGGDPSVTDVELYPGRQRAISEQDKDSLVAAIRAVEENSSHPVARAIVSYCKAHANTDAGAKLIDLTELPGRGMQATTESLELLVGNEALMDAFGVVVDQRTSETMERWKGEAKSIALVATRSPASSEGASLPPEEWTLAVALAVADPIRPEARPVVAALQAAGVRVWMLSGDNPITAAAVASRTGIPADQVIAGVLPTEKAARISYLQGTLKARAGRHAEHSIARATVAMVGDGINDSPALATADVSVAIGSGADVAVSSAEFVLVKSDLRAVLTLIQLSRTVFLRIKSNFAWALVYNCVAVPVAAGVFYPLRAGRTAHVRLDPVWASLAMALSSISVVLSSLALRFRMPIVGFRERIIEVVDREARKL